MNAYEIVVDSTTDLTPELADSLGVCVIPYIFTLDQKEYHNYLDYREISKKDFYNTLRAGKTASTTQVTPTRYREVWEPFLKEGKDVLYMCLSSMLSKSFEMSVLAARELTDKYPDRKIVTIDSKSASLGQGALAFYSSKAKESGKSLEENAKYVDMLIPKLHHWVMADDLHHLRRGGRVSGASAFVGTMLSIKPILTMPSDGRLVPIHKARGRAKAFDYFLEKAQEYRLDKAYDTVFISHSDAEDMAMDLRLKFEDKLGVRNFVINEIGPVIGAHTGPGTVAIMYVAEGDRAAAK